MGFIAQGDGQDKAAEVHWICNLWRTSAHCAESHDNKGN